MRPSGRRIPPLARPNHNFWLPLHGANSIANPEDDDLPGIKFFARHESFGGQPIDQSGQT